jgi:hypothetical protein
MGTGNFRKVTNAFKMLKFAMNLKMTNGRATGFAGEATFSLP